MNPTVRGILEKAVKSLQVPEPTKSIQAGSFNITRKGEGDVQEMSVGQGKVLKAEKLDGNISADAFDKLW